MPVRSVSTADRDGALISGRAAFCLVSVKWATFPLLRGEISWWRTPQAPERGSRLCSLTVSLNDAFARALNNSVV